MLLALVVARFLGVVHINEFFLGNLQLDCTKNNEVAPCLLNQNTKRKDEEAKPTPIFFKIWMKLPNFYENITPYI
jgi:hypothetical protein